MDKKCTIDRGPFLRDGVSGPGAHPTKFRTLYCGHQAQIEPSTLQLGNITVIHQIITNTSLNSHAKL